MCRGWFARVPQAGASRQAPARIGAAYCRRSRKACRSQLGRVWILGTPRRCRDRRGSKRPRIAASVAYELTPCKQRLRWPFCPTAGVRDADFTPQQNLNQACRAKRPAVIALIFFREEQICSDIEVSEDIHCRRTEAISRTQTRIENMALISPVFTTRSEVFRKPGRRFSADSPFNRTGWVNCLTHHTIIHAATECGHLQNPAAAVRRRIPFGVPFTTGEDSAASRAPRSWVRSPSEIRRLLLWIS